MSVVGATPPKTGTEPTGTEATETAGAAAAGAAAPGPGAARRCGVWVLNVVSAAVGIAAWWIYARTDPTVPTPPAVVGRAADLFADGTLQADILASLRRVLIGFALGTGLAIPACRIGAASKGGATFADNISATPLHQPVTTRVADPGLGTPRPAYSDEFDGSGRPETGDPAWTWVRGGTATATKSGGALVWPTQAAELHTGNNTASVLLRAAPACDFTVETKLTFDGTRGNQQAGIVLYQHDDRYFKLAHSVLPLASGGGAVLQQTEFGKEAERPTSNPPQAVANGPMFGGPAAPTMWLRLKYTYDSAGNLDVVREASSVDGVSWTWGGAWTVPHTGALRIGLVSMNATGATATFDYVRTFGGC